MPAKIIQIDSYKPFVIPSHGLTNEEINIVIDFIHSKMYKIIDRFVEEAEVIQIEVLIKESFQEFRNSLLCKRLLRYYLIDEFFIQNLEIYFRQGLSDEN